MSCPGSCGLGGKSPESGFLAMLSHPLAFPQSHPLHAHPVSPLPPHSQGLGRVIQAAAEPRSLCPSRSQQHTLSSVCTGWGGPVPTLSPPGPGRTLTVARMWVWASRSSCLSPSVSAVTAYLVAL